MKSRNYILIIVAALFLLSACVFPQDGVTPSPSPEPTEPTPLSPDAVIFTWSRIGGIAGFCDQLTVTADGRAVAVPCQSSFLPEPQPLQAADWAELQGWLDAYAPFSDVQTDGAVADSMTVTLDFFGWGTAAAGTAEREAMRAFAGRVFTAFAPTPAPPPTSSGPCLVVADSDVTVYQRPSLLASVFGVLTAGEPVSPAMLSIDGWYGFDPGVAQAANVGVFRMRWIPPDADVTVTGDCASLPVAPVLSPTACYLMAMTDVPVFAAPDEGSAVVATLAAEGYVVVTGFEDGGWLEVDLSDSSQPQDAEGYVRPADANFNGACDG